MAQYHVFRYTTSDTEIKEIGLAWFVLSVAFAILFTGGLSFSLQFFVAFIFAGVTVGLSFLLHELSHKIVAQKYGCFAEFRAFREMLFVSIIFSFMGFILAAPGAVMISGYVNRIANGKIASAGVLMNIVLAFCFFIAMLFMPSALLNYGLHINALLAAFNLLPFGLFDGAKIFAWDKRIWGGMLFASGLLLVVSGMV